MEFQQKYIAEGLLEEIWIEDHFQVLKMKNDKDESQTVVREIDSSFIQFHYTIKGSGIFSFNNGSYTLPMHDETSLLLYNPQRDLPMNLELKPNTWVVSLIISIKKFHSLFSADAEYIPFLSEDNKDKKYYNDMPITPSMAVVLNQLMNFTVHPSLNSVYHKAKAYELLCLHFNKPGDADVEQCPFLADEVNVQKIKKAKDIIIDRMAEPPSVQDLALEVGLSLAKLKDGFKQIYGEPVYTFLFDHKMELACKLLSQGDNVNEVGLKLGYSTSSHFIAAFKKKHNTTPKKYVGALNH